MSQKICVLGDTMQGLIAAALLAKHGHQVTIAKFIPDNLAEFHPKYHMGRVSHLPCVLPDYIIHDLGLNNYGFQAQPVANPFEALPFYDGLKTLVAMFESLDHERPPYKEKAWRDAWNTFECGRVLAQYPADIQDLFAKSATLSLKALLDSTDLDDAQKADIIVSCCIGSKTNPFDAGSAAAILPAVAPYCRTDTTLVKGSVTAVIQALKDAAMAYGAMFVEDQTIRRLDYNDDSAITSVILNDETELTADYYIADIDPVLFADQYIPNYPFKPAYRNRIAPDKNLKLSVRAQIALDQPIANLSSIIAPTCDFIKQAYDDFAQDGGSQYPILSCVDVTKSHSELAPDGHQIIHVIAQYFQPGLEASNEDALKSAIIQSLEMVDKEVNDKIVHITIDKTNSQFGMPAFTTNLPLLQLYKVFAGYHSMSYDMPITNLMFAGYGVGATAHPHMQNGGVRVAHALTD